ncbi:PREDICTED: vacuolar amino acid transporter 1-like [Nelumbo nucifera]|uniref:Vacuolar amino acid transporter 1-like n=2 Tax=Nelumbo nucifera TaxID=4432 RepID=A0A1U8AQK6_NELNU|nr:PREDICTED: vacuolar amino acid transporter 1-like [Nelumbo nucifera]DAD45555.1 TPA_asm: hypothetical protein HUJ06_003785 [Nelumbo nucifera]
MSSATQQSKEISLLKTFINGINALSGIGIISTPYALSEGGWLSLILLLLIAASAYFTGLLLRRCMDADPQITSYPDIAGSAFGRKGRIVASIFICLELYFVATELLIMEGDNLHKLSPNFALKLGQLRVEGKHSFVIIAGLTILPSMWLSDLGMLSYISAGGALSSLIIIISVLCVGASTSVGFHGKGRLINLQGMPTALSLYTFCYGAHGIFPTIYNSMKNKSQFPKVLCLSYITSTIAYVSMAILGYLMFGKDVQSQVTLNLPTENISSKIAIYTTLVGPLAKYALTVMPIVTAIESRLPVEYQKRRPVSLLIRTLLLFSTVVLAVVFPFFGYLMAFIGAVLIVVVSFLLPCTCYLKITGAYRNWGYETVGIVGIMSMATLVGVVGTYSSVVQTVRTV